MKVLFAWGFVKTTKLLSTYSNLCEKHTQTSETGGQTDGQTDRQTVHILWLNRALHSIAR